MIQFLFLFFSLLLGHTSSSIAGVGDEGPPSGAAEVDAGAGGAGANAGVPTASAPSDLDPMPLATQNLDYLFNNEILDVALFLPKWTLTFQSNDSDTKVATDICLKYGFDDMDEFEAAVNTGFGLFAATRLSAAAGAFGAVTGSMVGWDQGGSTAWSAAGAVAGVVGGMIASRAPYFLNQGDRYFTSVKCKASDAQQIENFQRGSWKWLH